MFASIRALSKYVAIFSLLAAGSAQAGTSQGRIGQLVIGHGGTNVFVEVLATAAAFPCASTHPNGFRYAFSTDRPGGKDMLATLLAARAADQPVLIVGTGSCTVINNMEDISYLWLY